MSELVTAFGPMLGFYLIPLTPLLWTSTASLFDKVSRRHRKI